MAIALRRVAAFCLDWCVIAIWGGLLFGIVMWSSGGHPEPPAGPWTGQLLGLLGMTLPVVTYFTACESAPVRGTLGKRALGLIVVDLLQTQRHILSKFMGQAEATDYLNYHNPSKQATSLSA